MNYFSINGYWKDNSEAFERYIVKESEEIIESEDDSIFFYGLSERDIKKAIEEGQETGEDFVITSYIKL